MEHQTGGGRRDFPRLLETARAEAGMTRSDLARAINASEETVRRWEAGTSAPRSAKVARTLDGALGTAFERLLFGSGPPAAEPVLSQQTLLDRLAAVEQALRDHGLFPQGRTAGRAPRGTRRSAP